MDSSHVRIEFESMPERIFVISDVHANLPALEAVLNLIPEDAPIFCAGDVVGYYTEPNEVCEMLQARRIPTIRGNHDAYVTGQLQYSSSREDKYRVQWTRDRLTPANLNWLIQLPTTIDIVSSTRGNGWWDSMRIRHANQLDEESYIYPTTPVHDSHIHKNGVLVVGHTHHPMVRVFSDSILVNPGSVGQPRDRNPDAAYAELLPAMGSVIFRRVQYGVQAYQAELKSSGIVEEMLLMLSRVPDKKNGGANSS